MGCSCREGLTNKKKRKVQQFIDKYPNVDDLTVDAKMEAFALYAEIYPTEKIPDIYATFAKLMTIYKKRK